MKWISRVVLAVCLGVMLWGWAIQQPVGRRSTVSVGTMDGSLWDKFKERVRYVIYGPEKAGWLDASTHA